MRTASKDHLLNELFEDMGLPLKASEYMEISITGSTLSEWEPELLNDGVYRYSPTVEVYERIVNLEPVVVTVIQGEVKVEREDSGFTETVVVREDEIPSIYNTIIDSDLLGFLGCSKLIVKNGDIVLVSDGSGEEFDTDSLNDVTKHVIENRDTVIYDIKKAFSDFAGYVRSASNGEIDPDLDMITFNGGCVGFSFMTGEDYKYFLAVAGAKNGVIHDMDFSIQNKEDNSVVVSKSIPLSVPEHSAAQFVYGTLESLYDSYCNG